MTEEMQTKTCPYCGEEILAVAQKCKHCGEFLDKGIHSTNSKIDSLDVNEKWKARFKIVEKQVIEGKWWKYNSGFWKIPVSERMQMGSVLYLSDFMSTFAAFFFGPIYYLCKGLWLKTIIYTIASFLTGGLLVFIIFFCLAPYDYYRLKVYGKQW